MTNEDLKRAVLAVRIAKFHVDLVEQVKAALRAK